LTCAIEFFKEKLSSERYVAVDCIALNYLRQAQEKEMAIQGIN